MSVKTTVKAAIFALISSTLVMSAPAKAATSEALLELSRQYRYEGYDYEVNEKLGRARLNIKLVDLDAGAEESGATTRSVLVHGLRYDSIRQEIVFERDGTYAVCATVTPKRFLFARYLKIKETGNCTVTAEPRLESWDDGFNAGTRQMTDIVFNAR